MQFPEELRYTKDHEWIRLEGDIATVGITEFAQRELGDIVYVEIESQDDTIEQAEVFGTVEAVKTVSDLFMPVTGSIEEVNDALQSEPELVNSDPYGQGWMIRIRMQNTEDYNSLLSAQEYAELVGQ
jgi:glycine cleavage system H protein